jgi:histidinol-phosphatase (PHP family)
MKIDYHIHTAHSVDAEGSLAAYCDQALRIGLNEICFTNHVELDPKRRDNLIRFDGNMVPITRDRVAVMHDAIHDIADEYRTRGLKVNCGIEIGYYEGVGPRIQEITRGLEFDFLLGSIHCLEHVCIDSSKEYEGYFQQHDVRSLLAQYYNAIEHLAKSRLFDSIAHIDVYKKYGLGFYGETIGQFPVSQVEQVCRIIAEHDIAIEINTAGLRRVNEIYPSAPILQCAYEAGVIKLSIGSDAHRPEDLGKGLSEGIALAKSIGYDAVYRFEKRTAYRVAI